jgi:sulfate permease, SulP family
MGSGTRPIAPWLDGYGRDELQRDTVAGLTVAVLLVPQGMAYAALAGMPPITGLYAGLVALVVYALLGSSSHLSYGPVAIIGLLTATGVGPLADGDPVRFAALAGTLALMVGAIHVLLGLLRFGAVVELIAHPVIVGFTGAAGIVIALTQAKDLLGIDVERSERAVEAIGAVVAMIGDTHPATFAVGAATVALLLAGRRFAPRFPTALLAVVLGVGATLLLGLDAAGVRSVGEIPAGLPRPTLPGLVSADLVALLPTAIVVALLSFAESISIGKAIAGRSRETLDANRELLASGAANAAAGLAGGFPVAGSFSRSFLTFSARGRTQAAGLVAAAVLALTLTVLTPLLEPLPRAVLAAIVFVTVIGLVDVAEARRIARVDRTDGAVLGITFVATLTLGVELGLATGIVVNLLLYMRRSMRPDVVVLSRLRGTEEFRNCTRHDGVEPDLDGLILRIDGPLDFLSARTITTRVREQVAARPDLDWIVLDCSSMSSLDATGLHALHELQLQLRAAGVRLQLATLRGPQRDIVRRADLAGDLLEQAASESIDEALAAIGVPEDALLRRRGPDETVAQDWS